jgi:hypothetical protein
VTAVTAFPPGTVLAPISALQAYFLQLNTDTRSDDAMRLALVLCYATLVEPRVDLRRLQRALDKLVARHDSLRLRLVRSKGEWRAAIYPPGPAVLHRIDLGDPDEATMMTRLRQIANAPMELVDGPLFETVLVHCGRRGDVVVTRVNHAVADGFGIIVMIEDQLKFLLGLPVDTPAMSHAEYVQRFHDLPPARARIADAFWADVARDLPTAPRIGRLSRGRDPLWRDVWSYEIGSLALHVTEASRARVTARAERLRVGPSTLWFAAMAEAVCAQYGLKALTFATTVGRTDPRLAQFVGDVHSNVLLSWQATGPDRFDEGVTRYAALLLAGMAQLPHGIARDATPERARLHAMGINPNLLVVRENGAMSRERSSPFAHVFRVPEGAPQQFGPYWLSRLDLSQPRRAVEELGLSLHSPFEPPGVTLSYDRLGFDAGEIAALAGRVCALLDLDRAGGTL